jgi:hypothetical protein
MTAAIIGIGASVWPEYIRPHPYVIAFLGLIGLVLLFFPTLYELSSSYSQEVVTLPAFSSMSEPIQDMHIELIEHGEFSPELLLECVNHGGPVTLTANLRVIGASPNLAYKRGGYTGTWVKPVSLSLNRVGVEYNSKSCAYVATGGSANLRIATIDAPQKPEGNAYMHLSGTDEWATWDLEHTATTDLPYFSSSVWRSAPKDTTMS